MYEDQQSDLLHMILIVAFFLAHMFESITTELYYQRSVVSRM